MVTIVILSLISNGYGKMILLVGLVLNYMFFKYVLVGFIGLLRNVKPLYMRKSNMLFLAEAENKRKKCSP